MNWSACNSPSVVRFNMPPSFTARELAKRFGLTLAGNGDTRVSSAAPLTRARADQLSFLANPRLRPQLAASSAGIVIAREADAEGHPGTVLFAQDPYLSYAKLATVFERTPAHPPGIHPSTDIANDAEIDPSASIAAFVSIGARSRIEAGARSARAAALKRVRASARAA